MIRAWQAFQPSFAPWQAIAGQVAPPVTVVPPGPAVAPDAWTPLAATPAQLAELERIRAQLDQIAAQLRALLADVQASRPAAPSPTPVGTVTRVRDCDELLRALEAAKPGSEIVLADGEYVLPDRAFTLVGTADAPIRIRAEGTGARIASDKNRYGLHLAASAHVRLEGLEFAPRGPFTAHALYAVDARHVAVVGCRFGAGGQTRRDASPIAFEASGDGGPDANSDNTVQGCTIAMNMGYRTGHGVSFGAGGGARNQVLDNEIHARKVRGKVPELAPMIAFDADGRGRYREITISGNKLVSDEGCGGGILLAGVDGATVERNRVRLRRDRSGKGGEFFVTRESPPDRVRAAYNDFAWVAS